MIVPDWMAPRMHRFALQRSVAGLLLVAAAVASTFAAHGPAHARADAGCAFANPIQPGADPWVLRHENAYWFAESHGDAIVLQRSASLTGPREPGVTIWRAPADGWNRSGVWAPELHFIDGRWVVYYTAGRGGPPWTERRVGVLQSEGADPRGPWIDRGMLYTGDGLASGTPPVWAIDLTVARIGGRMIAIWSGWDRNADTDRTVQHLYAAAMDGPTRIVGDRVRLSSPVEPWERGEELDLQEGPTVLTRGEDTFILYSTGESWRPTYKLGWLRLVSPTADPLRADSWTKSAGPVFQGGEGVHGVGHASFTTSPDGSEHWVVYHAKSRPDAGWQDRQVRMQRFNWRADGTPDFGVPVPSGAMLARPAGECRDRPMRGDGWPG